MKSKIGLLFIILFFFAACISEEKIGDGNIKNDIPYIIVMQQDMLQKNRLQFG